MNGNRILKSHLILILLHQHFYPEKSFVREMYFFLLLFHFGYFVTYFPMLLFVMKMNLYSEILYSSLLGYKKNQ